MSNTASSTKAIAEEDESNVGSDALDGTIDQGDRVTLEDAIAMAGDVEAALLEKADMADRDLVKFQSAHNLSNDRTLWAYQFLRRLRFMNKKYRGKTKQALADQARELKILHTESGMCLNAYKHVTDLVDLALTHCRAVYDYNDRCQQFYDRHTQDGTMLPQKRETTRRSLIRAHKAIIQLRVAEHDIRSTYAAWKPCIALLSTRVKYLVHLRLRARKLSEHDFEEGCDTLFNVLLSVVADRQNVRNKIDFAGTIQTVVWFSLRETTVSQEHLAGALGRYEGLEQMLLKNHDAQRAVLRKIDDMYERAISTPSTLPGVDGTEIPVERLLATLTEYEQLAAQCREAYTLAKSTAENLRSALSLVPGM